MLADLNEVPPPQLSSDIEVFRFVLVDHGKEVSCEAAFVCYGRGG